MSILRRGRTTDRLAKYESKAFIEKLAAAHEGRRIVKLSCPPCPNGSLWDHIEHKVECDDQSCPYKP